VNQEIEAPLCPDAFQKFVRIYRGTYHEEKMDDEIASMWFDRLCHIKTTQFEDVTTSLLGSKDYAFKWTDVLKKMNIMFPPTYENKALEQAWKSEQNNHTDENKKEKMGKIMVSVFAMIDKNKSGWRIEYFERLFELLGEEECMDIAISIQFQFPEFKDYLYSKGSKI